MASISSDSLLRVWRGVGWFGVALLLFLSLTPKPPPLSIDHSDKIGHALAYATLMFWWAQVFVTTRQRLWLGVGLILLGITIEYVQGWTGWRAFEYLDMLADTIGVVFGGITAAMAPNLLTQLICLTRN